MIYEGFFKNQVQYLGTNINDIIKVYDGRYFLNCHEEGFVVNCMSKRKVLQVQKGVHKGSLSALYWPQR